MMRRFTILASFVLLALAGAGCSGAPEASHSLQFDRSSDKAIVIIGTSVTEAQKENARGERSLATFWLEYDPETRHLVPDGKTFQTKVVASPLSGEPAYLKPTVSVLEVEPGDYAMIGAGFPHLMTTYVRPRSTKLLNGSGPRRYSWHHTVDPRIHVDPEAPVDPRANVLFTVLPGEVLYIGHFQFVKRGYSDSLQGINYEQDAAAARQALADYPGISGIMRTFDPARPPQSVSR